MIGMSCTHFCNVPPEYWAGKVAETFRHWEIFSEAEHSLPGREAVYRELLGTTGMTCSVHAPICDLNVAALSDRLLDASVRETCAVVVAAAEIGAQTVTIHPGLSSMAVNGTVSMAMERAKRSMKTFDRIQDEYGVPLAIENMPDVHFFLGRTAESLADIIDGTDLNVCYDIGHAHTTGQEEAMVEILGDRIVNVHIHDNNGKKDEHLTLGEGNVDLVAVLKSLSGYSGNYIIESKDLESAVESHSRLQKFLS